MTDRQTQMAVWQFYQIKIVIAGTLPLYRSDLAADGFKYTSGVQTSGGYGPGGAESQSLSFTVNRNLGVENAQFKKGTKVELYAGFGSSATSATYEKVATLYVDSCRRSMSAAAVQCYDALHYVGDRTTWVPVTFPSTVGAIIQSAVSQLGVPLASTSFAGADIPVDLRDKDGKQPALDITVRQAIAEACLISGNFARVDRDGSVVVDWFKPANATPDASIPSDFIKDYTFDDDAVIYTAVKVGDLEIYGNPGKLPSIGTAVPGYEPTPTGVYYLPSATFLTTDNAAAVQARLYAALCDGRTLYSASVTAAGDLSIVPGMQVHGDYYGATPDPGQPRLMFPRTIPVCGLTWDGSMNIVLTCPTGDAANADDLRPKAGEQQIRNVTYAELANPNSNIRKKLDTLYTIEGGGGTQDERIGDLDDLYTNAKWSVVGAMNELAMQDSRPIVIGTCEMGGSHHPEGNNVLVTFRCWQQDAKGLWGPHSVQFVPTTWTYSVLLTAPVYASALVSLQDGVPVRTPLDVITPVGMRLSASGEDPSDKTYFAVECNIPARLIATDVFADFEGHNCKIFAALPLFIHDHGNRSMYTASPGGVTGTIAASYQYGSYQRYQLMESPFADEFPILPEDPALVGGYSQSHFVCGVGAYALEKPSTYAQWPSYTEYQFADRAAKLRINDTYQTSIEFVSWMY